ncbi:5-methyltetrahydropteroyltriglutamate--homocysteine S-methyltransferase [Ureibacillus chungkukjangi]|uniref:5-methyltetrahydropteroyltriglutamate--homocysteine methyltransferase n=1 Tax=Ureibacillus chungkukjangi TaxID=1202712 RepID=A0A318TPA0_9BACL|nr:5-methyltetrahydropteroyltriglutamate--homocysteine S-methyltransferase [Ureibacillus chungkukjangi]MCM3388800.1 5-methyltetrahydropteroyltriglutamate--homocysteine S-methyltransferase [Ureibacillus chungkukjangi]PYF06711.1 methionine synthase (B12-independent) [Ureibacillus chungkukjangi]
MNVVSTVVGYPYIGENREWKRIVEGFWKKELTEQQFEQQMKAIRLEHIQRQQALGLDLIPIGDFTYYDRMLDLAMMFNIIPNRYNNLLEKESALTCYYAMARGTEQAVACEMTKWFNTNYHYIVPEYEGQHLYVTENRLLAYFLEAKEELGLLTKPTLIGPYTFVDLSKGYDEKTRAAFILALIPLYAQVLKELVDAGAEWIQLEEPSLTKSLSSKEARLVEEIYKQLTEAVPEANIMLQTYFEALTNYENLIQLPVAGIGLDFVHGKKENLEALRKSGFPKDKVLNIGIVNGRDIWSANLAEVASDVQAILNLSNANDLWVSSSCSLQHVPVTTANERKLDSVLLNALSFADEKINEIVHVAHFLSTQHWAKEGIVSESMECIRALATHPVRNNARVNDLVKSISNQDFVRLESFEERREIQKTALGLPDFPTTTIGSFPQSPAVKKTRAAWRKNELTNEEYAAFIKEETARWIAIQEEIGLDVLVHGEFERTDMVEYFGEQLTGFAFTEKAWVVSYGSRCVKPPIIYGDVEWSEAMTVKEVVDAQSLTSKYVKGMLTGPVTILNWSFVRNDIPREAVANQIALALRKEVEALEQAGIQIIQVDEPALREGLPLRREDWSTYLEWAVNAFKLATSSVKNETQIHTHMCYCEFNDFLDPIRALDADVISLETSRSHGELIASLKENPYELGIGLGVYDIHSPRIPQVEEMETILKESLEVLSKEQFWVNPDCGLKTRQESETIAALKRMVQAAKLLRDSSRKTLVN